MPEFNDGGDAWWVLKLCSGRNVGGFTPENLFNISPSGFRIALVQLAVTANKAQNLSRARDKIKEAVSSGAKLVALPVGAKFSVLPRITFE